MGDVLKQAASVASSGAGSAVWGLFADYYAALGFRTSAREALLKQVLHQPCCETRHMLGDLHRVYHACHSCSTACSFDEGVWFLELQQGSSARLKPQEHGCCMPCASMHLGDEHRGEGYPGVGIGARAAGERMAEGCGALWCVRRSCWEAGGGPVGGRAAGGPRAQGPVLRAHAAACYPEAGEGGRGSLAH